MATGRIERGKVKVGEEADVVGLREAIQKTVVTGVEMFRKELMKDAGDNVGLLCAAWIRTRSKEEWFWPRLFDHAAQKLRRKFILTKEEGGRHTPFLKGYRPQFYFRTTDVTERLNCPPVLRCVWATMWR